MHHVIPTHLSPESPDRAIGDRRQSRLVQHSRGVTERGHGLQACRGLPGQNEPVGSAVMFQIRHPDRAPGIAHRDREVPLHAVIPGYRRRSQKWHRIGQGRNRRPLRLAFACCVAFSFCFGQGRGISGRLGRGLGPGLGTF
ncbi:MAG: hypothetical protein R3F31_28010 [Verrucomicrobiales bacterium]